MVALERSPVWKRLRNGVQATCTKIVDPAARAKVSPACTTGAATSRARRAIRNPPPAMAWTARSRIEAA
ncbi:hypothetical protein Kisp02_22750 [Kineosporia sp. NBRC 101731]|nr:hypothetical protein Kisp02_22750 [Kineosporia sp. NBRC 101731]